MTRLTPSEAQQKHNTRTKNALEDMKKGVARVTESPMAKAADSQEKMLMNLTDAINSGRWAKSLRGVSLEEWKSKMINKGANRVPAGLDAAASKTQKFYEEFFPVVDAAKAEVDRMPSMTLEDNINRMTTYVRKIAQFKKGA